MLGRAPGRITSRNSASRRAPSARELADHPPVDALHAVDGIEQDRKQRAHEGDEHHAQLRRRKHQDGERDPGHAGDRAQHLEGRQQQIARRASRGPRAGPAPTPITRRRGETSRTRETGCCGRAEAQLGRREQRRRRGAPPRVGAGTLRKSTRPQVRRGGPRPIARAPAPRAARTRAGRDAAPPRNGAPAPDAPAGPVEGRPRDAGARRGGSAGRRGVRRRRRESKRRGAARPRRAWSSLPRLEHLAAAVRPDQATRAVAQQECAPTPLRRRVLDVERLVGEQLEPALAIVNEGHAHLLAGCAPARRAPPTSTSGVA